MPTPNIILNIRAVIIILNGTFNLFMALWIYMDATRRRAGKPLFAALAVLLLGPLWLAFYLTDRPLCADERRNGGFGWNWTRNFAWAWTGATASWLAAAVVILTRAPIPDPPRVIVDLLGLWLVPIGVALAIGWMVRKSAVTEAGGPAPARAPVPLAAFFVITMLASWLALSALHGWILPYN